MKVKLNASNASHARNSMMMTLYSALFDWLIERVNEAVAVEGKPASMIGVLDIFGFEIFTNNGFEQLCINYANEMLQLHFNTYTFQLETELCVIVDQLETTFDGSGSGGGSGGGNGGGSGGGGGGGGEDQPRRWPTLSD